MPQNYELYTDGACKDNPGPGGWAFVLKTPEGIVSESGYDPRTTNNRMELTAALKGLCATPKGSSIVLFSDSTYLINGLGKWIFAWQKKNFIRDGQQIPNTDLWKKLYEAASARKVTYRHVRGHSGNPLNEQCDMMARSAAEKGVQSAQENAELSPEASALLNFLFDKKLDKTIIVAVLRESLRFISEDTGKRRKNG